MLSRNMTPQSMRRYYENGGRISDIMEVTGKDYETVRTALKGCLVTGGHRNN